MSLPMADPTLSEHDPELFAIIEKEKHRQFSGLEMIASENFTSRAVMECLGSCLTNKYSEGEVGARYYGGNEFIDMVEGLAKKRALAAYGLNEEEWAVNVQPYSGSPANFAVYTGLLNPHDRIMGLDLPSGGHLTHGYYTPTKKISASSIYFESLPYHTGPDQLIDFDELAKQSMLFRPKIIIAGHSAYPRELDYPKFKAAADNCGALLMVDMAHISGLVATGEQASPFAFADVVTTTTHKSLRGPRAGMIFIRKQKADGTPTDYVEKINFAVFPGLQGGPHQNAIGGIATQLKQVATEEFRLYSKQVRANARALAEALMKKDIALVTGGTDNHIVLIDLRPKGLTGSKVEKVLELVNCSVNKNALVGDKSSISPSGIRIGTTALTTRGFLEGEFLQVADIVERAINISIKIQDASGKQLKAFMAALVDNADIAALRATVEALATKYPMPGVGFEHCKLTQ